MYLDGDQLDAIKTLQHAFRELLMACLEECAAGRRGLFSDVQYLSLEAEWPEAVRLRELAMTLQAVMAQADEPDKLCEQFLDLCTIHGESDHGESRLARAFLANIEQSGK